MTADIAQLKDLPVLAKNGSPAQLRALLERIVEIFLTRSADLNPHEREHFDIIITRLTARMDAAVRREVANKFAAEPLAPAGLIRQLAYDDFDIAEPVLKSSKILKDEDLVVIAGGGDERLLKAIAARRDVSEAVADVLAERGGEDILLMLAKNQRARLHPSVMAKLVAAARKIKSLQPAVAARFDLSPLLLTHIYFFAAPVLKNEILKRSTMLDPALVDEAVAANRAKVLSAASQVGDTTSLADLAEQNEDGAVDDALLKKLAEASGPDDFVLAFSYFTGVDPQTGKAILADQRFEALAIAGRALGLAPATFEQIMESLRHDRTDAKIAARTCMLYSKIPQTAAERIMRFWRLRGESSAPPDTGKSRIRKLHEVADRAAL